jgi:hypothetical protein
MNQGRTPKWAPQADGTAGAVARRPRQRERRRMVRGTVAGPQPLARRRAVRARTRTRGPVAVQSAPALLTGCHGGRLGHGAGSCQQHRSKRSQRYHPASHLDPWPSQAYEPADSSNRGPFGEVGAAARSCSPGEAAILRSPLAVPRQRAAYRSGALHDCPSLRLWFPLDRCRAQFRADREAPATRPPRTARQSSTSLLRAALLCPVSSTTPLMI